jgi:hypothetical protein
VARIAPFPDCHKSEYILKTPPLSEPKLPDSYKSPYTNSYQVSVILISQNYQNLQNIRGGVSHTPLPSYFVLHNPVNPKIGVSGFRQKEFASMLVQKTGIAQGEEKMSKFKFITLAASIMLALAFTISCSDDKDEGGGYLSCEEMGRLLEDGFMGGNPDTYVDALDNKCKNEHGQEIIDQCLNKPSEAEMQACAGNIIMACMSKDESVKKLCGSNNLEACKEHYDDICKE